MDLAGVMLITNRLDDCIAFYTELLASEPDLGAGWAQFRLPNGGMLALHTPWDPSLPVDGGSTVTLLEVGSLASEQERLDGTRISLSEPHDIPGGRVVTTSDPDGRLVQLMEHERS